MIVEKSIQQYLNLYYDLYIPDADTGRARPLLIALHGYEGNKDSMMRLALKINSSDLIIASVQGPSAFFIREGDPQTGGKIGFGWMMQYKSRDTIDLHHRTLTSVIEAVGGDCSIDKRAIFLLAFSQTVSLNYRFAFTNPGLIRGVIAVCGGIPGDWNEEKYHRSNTDVLIVAGESDEFYPLDKTLTFKDAMARRAPLVEFHSFDAGHVFPRESLPVINDWILARVGQRG